MTASPKMERLYTLLKEAKDICESLEGELIEYNVIRKFEPVADYFTKNMDIILLLKEMEGTGYGRKDKE